MAASTPGKLKNLRALLDAKPHKEVLRIYLQKHEVGLLKSAALVTVHRKWSAHPPYYLTELGITTYDRQRVRQGQPIHSGPHAEDLLKHVWCLHLRIRSHAHLPSASGDPNSYHFGTTIFVSQKEALDMLHEIWHQPMDETDPGKGLRPIVYMSYGDNNGVGRMRKAAFDFDPSSMSTTVAVLDAQSISVQAKITRSQDASLEYLLHQFKISPLDVDNGGNAAMYATVIAILSTLRNELYGSVDNPRAKAGQKGPSSAKSAQSVMQWLMEWPTPAPPFGIPLYCWRCGWEHAFTECPNSDLECSKCRKSPLAWRKENASSHMEGLCVFR
ncbi:Nn.00g085180.m01.CDS01 [Neocucurbitaria sp. VM-36]